MSATEKKLFFVINPHSGTQKGGAQLLKMIEVLSNDGYAVTVYPTKCRGDATKAVMALDDSFETVLVCGGDGTLNECITGLINGKKNFNIGYVPAGTQNEWSSGLRIPRKLVDAANVITNGRLVQLDIGKFNDEYFSYTASFGALTETSYSTPQAFKNVLGQAAYILQGIRYIGNIKPITLKSVYDGGECEGEFLFGAVSNSLSVGGVIKLNNNLVSLSDGMFEVLLIRKPQNAIKLQSLINSILTKNLNNPDMVFIHTKHLSIDFDSDVDWTLDGEHALGGTHVEIENLPRLLNFYVPNEEIEIL